MSTPPMAGMILRVGSKKGSVGKKMTFQGNVLRWIWGYQVRMMRKMKNSVIRPTRGLRIKLAIVMAFMELGRY